MKAFIKSSKFVDCIVEDDIDPTLQQQMRCLLIRNNIRIKKKKVDQHGVAQMVRGLCSDPLYLSPPKFDS